MASSDSHEDDYSDLLSAEERAEIKRARMKRWAATPADIPEDLTRQEYTFDAPEKQPDSEADAFAQRVAQYADAVRRGALSPMQARRMLGLSIEDDVAKTEQAGFIQPHPGARVIPEQWTTRPSWMPESLEALQAMIRQIVREEIERHDRDQYRRARVRSNGLAPLGHEKTPGSPYGPEHETFTTKVITSRSAQRPEKPESQTRRYCECWHEPDSLKSWPPQDIVRLLDAQGQQPHPPQPAYSSALFSGVLLTADDVCDACQAAIDMGYAETPAERDYYHRRIPAKPHVNNDDHP